MCVFRHAYLAAALFSAPALGQQMQSQFQVTRLNLVSAERNTRTQFTYTYRVEVANSGPDAPVVTAVVTSRAPQTVIVDGKVTFGDIRSGQTATSIDTLTLRQDRQTVVNPSDLSWTIGTAVPPPCSAGASILKVQPATAQQAATLNITIDGSGTAFTPGISTVDFGGGGVSINSVAVQSLNRLLVNATLAEDAVLGYRRVTVSTGMVLACSPEAAAGGLLSVVKKARNLQALPDAATGFQRFRAANGGEAQALWNPETGTPRSVFGFLSRPLAGTPEQRALSFLAENRDLLGLPQDLHTLALAGVVRFAGADHVRFVEMQQGTPAYHGNVSVHVRSDTGQVESLGAQYYPAVAPSNTVRLTGAQAVAVARAAAMPSATGTDTASQLTLYPAAAGFRSAWNVSLRDWSAPALWSYVVDADTGEILSQENRALRLEGVGSVFQENPIHTPTPENLHLLHLSPEYFGQLIGDYAWVTVYNNQPAAHEDSLQFIYPQTDPHFDETMAYYHTDNAHTYFSRLFDAGDPLNIRETALVHAPNTEYVPTIGMLFQDAIPPSINTAVWDADAIYHEYVHAVLMEKLQVELFNPEGKSLQEGTADYFAASKWNEPFLFEYVYHLVPELIRNVYNSKRYQDANGNYIDFSPGNDVHENGVIWGGACWDLRSALSSQDPSHDTADKLVLGGMSMLLLENASFPDGLFGIFSTDRRLYAGAHFQQIREAFENHGIRLDRLMAPAISSLIADQEQLTAGTQTRISASAADPNGDPLSYEWFATGGTLSGSGPLVSWTAPVSGQGDYTITVTVRDLGGLTDGRAVTVAVTPVPVNPLAITSSNRPPGGTVQTYYAFQPAASGGTPPYRWSVQGTLPQGLQINATSGKIDGTPTAAGSSQFTLRVTDSNSPAGIVERLLTITIDAAPVFPLTIFSSTVPTGVVGTFYTCQLDGMGGVQPYTWGVVSGSLPSGLSLSASGLLSGMPGAGAFSTFIVRLTDSTGAKVEQAFTLVINGAKFNHVQGAGLALADIDGNGRLDVIVLYVDNSYSQDYSGSNANHAYYRIGWNIQANGSATSWGPWTFVPGWFGDETAGAGLAVADIDGDGRPELVVFHVDNVLSPPGNNGYYRIGWNLDKSGNVTRWSGVMGVQGWFGDETSGVGVAVADIDRNGRQDLVFFHVDNPPGGNRGYYRIGWNINNQGNATAWSDVKGISGWFGDETWAAGIAFSQVDGGVQLDLILYHVDHVFSYRQNNT